MITKRLHDIAHINRKSLPESTPSDYEFRYVDISSVSEGRVSIPDETVKFGSAPSRARRCADAGDVLVSTVRTYLRAIAPAPASDEPLVYSTGFAVLEARPQVDKRFLSYACLAQPFLQEIESRSVGVSYPAINPSELAKIKLHLPPLEEQRRIADFLDVESSRLDQIVTYRRRQISLLSGRRWFLLEKLIGEQQTPRLPIRRAVRSVTDGPFGSAFSSSDYVDEGAAVVRLGNIGFDEYRPDGQAYISMEMYARFIRHRVRPGDILIAALGDPVNHAGRACLAPDLGSAIVKGKSLCARVNAQVADARYLSMVLSSGIGKQALTTRGSTRSMINIEILKAAEVPVPPLERQREIVLLVEASAQTERELVEVLEQQIKLLLERRQALITAAVTGEFDVTTA